MGHSTRQLAWTLYQKLISHKQRTITTIKRRKTVLDEKRLKRHNNQISYMILIGSWIGKKKSSVKSSSGDNCRDLNTDSTLGAITVVTTVLWFCGRISLLGDAEISRSEVSRCQQLAFKLLGKIKVCGNIQRQRDQERQSNCGKMLTVGESRTVVVFTRTSWKRPAVKKEVTHTHAGHGSTALMGQGSKIKVSAGPHSLWRLQEESAPASSRPSWLVAATPKSLPLPSRGLLLFHLCVSPLHVSYKDIHPGIYNPS
nr:uncharacterized protein LOC129488559 [Symphalangus syndactylus]